MEDKRKRMFAGTPFSLFFLFQGIVFLTYFCRKNEINLVFFRKIIIIDNETL